MPRRTVVAVATIAALAAAWPVPAQSAGEDARYRTASGARVGMSEAEVRRRYGPAMRVEPHPYTGPEGHYLIYRARGEPYGLIVETNYETGRAGSIRVGLWRYVQLIEGCS